MPDLIILRALTLRIARTIYLEHAIHSFESFLGAFLSYYPICPTGPRLSKNDAKELETTYLGIDIHSFWTFLRAFLSYYPICPTGA